MCNRYRNDIESTSTTTRCDIGDIFGIDIEKYICITSSITKIDTFIITAFYRTRWGKSSEAKSRNPEYTLKQRRLQCTHFEVHSSKCRLGQSETSKIEGNSWSSLISDVDLE